jgi:hypothetical protein
MRTVSFADKDVRQALGGFALAWKNIKDDPSSGSSFRHDPDEEASPLIRGIGNHNVQLLFLTPKAELVHVLAGYWSPKDLLREIEFARKLADLPKEKIVEAHRTHAAEDAGILGCGGSREFDDKMMKWLEDTQ